MAKISLLHVAVALAIISCGGANAKLAAVAVHVPPYPPVPSVSNHPLITDTGAIPYQVAPVRDGTLGALEKATAVLGNSRYLHARGAVHRLRDIDRPPMVRFVSLPHATGLVRVVTLGDSSFVASGRFLIEASKRFDRVVRKKQLNAQIASLQAHPSGMLLAVLSSWQFREGLLVAIDRKQLTVTWSLPGVYATSIALGEKSAFVIRNEEKRAVLAEVQLTSGLVTRKIQVAGGPNSDLRQTGHTLCFVAEAGAEPLGRSMPKLRVEQIDLKQWTHTSTPLSRIKAGGGDVRSGIVQIVHPTGVPGAIAVAVNGDAGMLHWLENGRHRVIRFPETRRYEKHDRLIQIGRSIVLAAKTRLHIFDANKGTYRGLISLPTPVRRLSRHRDDLLVSTDKTLLRLRPGKQTSTVTPKLVRALPWFWGKQSNTLLDGDPRSSWSFRGDWGIIELQFGTPTLVEAISIVQPTPTHGKLTTANLSISERIAPHRVTLSNARETPLLPNPSILRSIRIHLGCACQAKGCVPGQQMCSVSQIKLH